MDDLSAGISGSDFRHAMRAFATGVAIVACGQGLARAGCVATAVASLSLEPPTLIVNLQRDGSTYRRLRAETTFSINFLRADQGALARHFAGGAAAAERFSEGAWREGEGAPVLSDALACIECRVEEILERHTHAIVIGRVTAASADEGAALLHVRGKFSWI